MSELLRVERLHKRYENTAENTPSALGEVNLAIRPGEFVAVMGPSGSGKSTFMNILGCLDTPTSGAYFVQGKDVAQFDDDQLAELRNRTFGFVFQGFNLLKRMSAVDNVALPLLYSGMGHAERQQRAAQLLEQTGLGKHLKSLPNRLSGGQQQRVAIARALATRPPILLADEPTGNLDTQTSSEIMEVFTRLNQEQGITVILVTHEPDIAGYARRLVRFRDGNVVFDGAVAEGLHSL